MSCWALLSFAISTAWLSRASTPGAVREPDYVQPPPPPRRLAAFGTVTGLDTYPERWLVDIDRCWWCFGARRWTVPWPHGSCLPGAPRSRRGQKCAGSTPNLDRLRKVVRSRLQLGRERIAATQQLRPRIPASPTCTRASRRRRDGAGSASNYRPRATRDFASRSHRPACQACSTAIRPNFCAAA